MLIYIKQNRGVLSIAIRVGALNREEVVREVCTQLTPVKVNLEGRATFPMQRMTDMQREIDELKRELRHARRRR